MGVWANPTLSAILYMNSGLAGRFPADPPTADFRSGTAGAGCRSAIYPVFFRVHKPLPIMRAKGASLGMIRKAPQQVANPGPSWLRWLALPFLDDWQCSLGKG